MYVSFRAVAGADEENPDDFDPENLLCQRCQCPKSFTACKKHGSEHGLLLFFACWWIRVSSTAHRSSLRPFLVLPRPFPVLPRPSPSFSLPSLFLFASGWWLITSVVEMPILLFPIGMVLLRTGWCWFLIMPLSLAVPLSVFACACLLLVPFTCSRCGRLSACIVPVSRCTFAMPVTTAGLS